MVTRIKNKSKETDNTWFNPLKELFIAQEAKPALLGEINLRALTPFQRTLLMIDGTVTKFIEAYTLEPVEIVKLDQKHEFLPEDHSWLESSKSSEVIARQVLIWGKYSHTFFAYAASLIVPDRLSEDMRNILETEQRGLGKILLDSRIETYRELLWYGKESAERLPPNLRHLVDGDLISRTYRIIAAKKPIMLINEKFSSMNDRLPVHH